MLLWPRVQVRPEVPVSSFVRLPEEMSEGVPEALAERRGELLAYARRRVGDGAEDVVQEASVRALANAGQLRDPAAARAWLYGIVRRLLAERANVPSEALDESLPAESTEPPDACACVLTHLRALPEAQATLLQRVVVEGVDVAQLSAELGLTPNATWVRLHRAREALRQRLERHCGTHSLRQCLDCGCLERGCCR